MSEDDGNLCPRCGTPYAPGQEYCLECGHRLHGEAGLVGRLSNAWRRRFAWYPGDWIWPVLFGLLVAIVAGTVAAVVVDSGSGGGKSLVATQPGTPHEPTQQTPTATVGGQGQQLPTVPQGTPTTTEPPGTQTKPPPANRPAPRPGALVEWPANRSGYTVVIESIPASAGRALALARARAASRAGLPQVGVLTSSRYSSLHPGYFVVFSGIYASKGRADSAAVAANGKGFASAYSRQITR